MRTIFVGRILGVALTVVAASVTLFSQAATRGEAPPCGSSDATVVCTLSGAIKGVVEGPVIAFRGIPYAAPPTGARRWQPPQPPHPWTGIRNGSEFGPVCPQLAGTEVIGDEDCLTLNVQVSRERGVRLPVMVYFTGGGNHSQSGRGTNSVPFNGAKLLAEGVLLVTVNIRLGALGFLSHPALDSGGRLSGNYGNLDHIALLRWVSSNIAAFGGNPDRVFLFGTSAGGASICGLLVSPQAQGLFYGAAMQSSVPTGCEFKTAMQAQSDSGQHLVRAVGCDTASDVAACLRGKPAAELVRAIPAVTNLFARTYGPVVDGFVFPDQPLKLITAGRAARVPLIFGNTLEETAGWIAGSVGAVQDTASYSVALDRVFGKDLTERVKAQYPPEWFSSPRAAFLTATTDAMFTCATRRVAKAIVTGGGGPVYRYLFTHRDENDPGPVNHTNEMPMLFFSWRNYTPGEQDRAVSDYMVRSWAQMAKTGTPNASGQSLAWLSVSREEFPYMDLNAAPRMRSGDADTKCDFWDSIVLPSPHL